MRISKVHYFLVATGNAVLLILLSILKTDSLACKLQTDLRFYSELKVIGYTLLAIFASLVLMYFLPRKWLPKPSDKLVFIIGIFLIITAKLYIEFTAALIQNRFIDAKFRKQIAAKISLNLRPIEEISGKGLNSNEYIFVSKIKPLPKVHKLAGNIDFKGKVYDSFLGDYSIDVSYDLPAEIKVEPIKVERIGLERRQYSVISGSTQRVYYTIAQY